MSDASQDQSSQLPGDQSGDFTGEFVRHLGIEFAEVSGDRFHSRAQSLIGIGLPQVGEIARDDDRRRMGVYGADRVKRLREVLLDVVVPAQLGARGQEMRIADMDDHVRGGLIASEHGNVVAS